MKRKNGGLLIKQRAVLCLDWNHIMGINAIEFGTLWISENQQFSLNEIKYKLTREWFDTTQFFIERDE